MTDKPQGRAQFHVEPGPELHDHHPDKPLPFDFDSTVAKEIRAHLDLRELDRLLGNR